MLANNVLLQSAVDRAIKPSIILLGTLLLMACSVADDTMNAADVDESLLGGSTFQGATSGSDIIPKSCAVPDMNQWAYENMLDYYLFYDQVDRNINVESFETTEQLVTQLRIQPQDSFSYMTDETTYNSFFNEGETFGFGWNITVGPDNGIYFSLIDPGSPLDLLDVRRGDQLTSIDGIAIGDFLTLSTAEKTSILGDSREIKTIEIGIASPQGETRLISVTSSIYPIQTVLDTRVIEQHGIRVGYLHFYSFISTSSDELADAFAMLETENIDELVIDLRFNGGGRISVANELASYILGDGNNDKIFTTFAYNDKYQDDNVSLNFQDMSTSLDLYRVFVLQSDRTCSASELVINSLMPFIPVITVGSTSCGKPYGSSPNSTCGKVLNALEIELLNAENSGGYYNGIAADCPASDDISVQLGDVSEPLLSSALSYIETGSCGTAIARSHHKSRDDALLPKPAWLGGNRL
jgi:C-terminal processing protease CtpA/Prc